MGQMVPTLRFLPSESMLDFVDKNRHLREAEEASRARMNNHLSKLSAADNNKQTASSSLDLKVKSPPHQDAAKVDTVTTKSNYEQQRSSNEEETPPRKTSRTSRRPNKLLMEVASGLALPSIRHHRTTYQNDFEIKKLPLQQHI
jgi:hypothetical protein